MKIYTSLEAGRLQIFDEQLEPQRELEIEVNLITFLLMMPQNKYRFLHKDFPFMMKIFEGKLYILSWL
ncbi:MAG: hypothetical protein R2809_08430 [Flavobacteriales bacterium]